MAKKKKEAGDTVNVAAAKARLSQYLARAKRGQETIVTEFRVPVAKIVPFAPMDDDFEIIPPTESLDSLRAMASDRGAKRSWDSVSLLLADREER